MESYNQFEGEEQQVQTPTPPHSAHLPSGLDIVKSTIAIAQKRSKAILPFIIIPAVLSSIMRLASPAFGSSAAMSVLSVGLSLLAGIIAIISSIALINIFGKEESSDFGSYLKDSLKMFPAYLWITLLNGFLVFGGYLLFLIPGLIFNVWFGMSGYANILEHRKGLPALIRSKQLVAGRFWAVVARILLVVIIGIFISLAFSFAGGIAQNRAVSLITDLIIYMISLPLSVGYMTLLFKSLVASSDPAVHNNHRHFMKYILISISGYVIGPILIFLLIFSTLKSSGG